MPRLSLWNPRKGNDYKFIDKMVQAHFEHGGTALLIHKYLGSVDETDPNYDPANPPIQDLLFMENRDRKYETTVFELRGTYTVNDQELDEDAAAVNQYWVVQEGSKSSDGFDPGWWPHIWRVRCKQLQDTQEYSDIFGTGEEVDDLKNLLSTYNQELNINEAIVNEAQENVPGRYYDYRKNNLEYAVDGSGHPDDVDYSTVESGISFPQFPDDNAFFLRTDYEPNRLFQYRDNKWYKIEDDDGSWQVGNYLHHKFINNAGIVTLDDGTEIVSRVNLSQVIKPKIDGEA